MELSVFGVEKHENPNKTSPQRRRERRKKLAFLHFSALSAPLRLILLSFV